MGGVHVGTRRWRPGYRMPGAWNVSDNMVVSECVYEFWSKTLLGILLRITFYHLH